MLHSSQQTEEVWTHHYKLVDGYEINGQVFHRLYYTNNEDLSDWMPTDMYAIQDGYLVYWSYNSASFLAYDFSVEAGDTIYFGLEPFMGAMTYLNASEVDSIILLNGETRKRIKMVSTLISDSYWIEGIGTTHGELLRPYDGMDILLCYRQGEEVLYMNDEYSNCHIFTNTKELHKEKIAWSIHPNPAVGTASINLPQSLDDLNNTEILIYNQLGQLVWNNTLTQEEFMINNLPAGIYMVSIKNEKFHFVPQKLIIGQL